MTQDTHDTPTCNTKLRGRCWGPCTLNNYTDMELTELRTYAESDCLEYRINEETCPTTGTQHLQFGLYFKNARKFTSLKKKFPRAHLELAKSWEAVKKYCEKSDTRTGETYKKDRSKRRPLKDPLADKELYKFQKEVIEKTDEEADDRKIVWYYDDIGCAGKTTLAKHLCIKRPDEILYLSGKSSDIKYGVMTFLENPDNDLYICFIDLTRSVENFVSYEAIESVKNGIFYNTKYKSGMVVFNSPHVIIFANFPPDTSKLSQDRWEILTL